MRIRPVFRAYRKRKSHIANLIGHYLPSHLVVYECTSSQMKNEPLVLDVTYHGNSLTVHVYFEIRIWCSSNHGHDSKLLSYLPDLFLYHTPLKYGYIELQIGMFFGRGGMNGSVGRGFQAHRNGGVWRETGQQNCAFPLSVVSRSSFFLRNKSRISSKLLWVPVLP